MNKTTKIEVVKIIQAVLNNTFGFKSTISGFNFDISSFTRKIITNFLIDKHGIIRELNPQCPHCKSNIVVCNGYTSYENKLFTAFNLEIHKGQYLCHGCGQGYIIDLPQFNELSIDFKKTLKSLITSLRIRNLSYPNIAKIIKEVFGYKITGEYAREIFNEVSIKIRNLITYTKQSGYYAYDAQYLKINGRQFYRHVVHDLITGKVLIDTVLPKQNKETIKQLFLRTIKSQEVKSFVMDMANAYPGIIKDCYGEKVSIQWCLFHLHQDIGRKYKGCKKETDDSGFQNELNKQFLFDMLYPRPELIEHLNIILGWLKSRRAKLKYLDDKILKKVMKKTRAFFWRQYRELQKDREKKARKDGYKIVNSIEELQKKFNCVYKQKQIYPPKIRKVIEKMKQNWNKITLFLVDKKVPPTNNISERYFGKTCSKTQKKLFRSVDSALLKCKIHFLLENGTKIYEPFSIFKIISKYSFFFEKCNVGIT